MGSRGLLLVSIAATIAGSPPVPAQVFDNLKAFGGRLKTGDPDIRSPWEGKEGPKGIAAGDLNDDGYPDLAVSNLDGTITVFWNDGEGKFGKPQHLLTRLGTLRQVIIAELTPDDRRHLPDIAACAMIDGVVVVFPNLGGGTFGPPFQIKTWTFARNLTAADLDGDGRLELAVAGSGEGLRIYKNLGPEGGGFKLAAEFKSLVDAPSSGSKPVFSLRAFRKPGQGRDILAVTHAQSQEVLFISAGAGGTFEVKHLPGINFAYDIQLRPIASAASTGEVDLVAALRDEGKIQVWRFGAAAPSSLNYQGTLLQEIQVPGGPRSLEVLDLDGDDYNDLVVVLRDKDQVLTYRNSAAGASPGTELLIQGAAMPVGQSPRYLAASDFNGDGHADVGVNNRLSQDVSVLTASLSAAGFTALDQLYFVDGNPAALALRDLNGDGRDDVVQLHRSSSQASVRLAGELGLLRFPKYHSVGPLPNALRLADLDGDGRTDLVTANLGYDGTAGSLSVLPGEEGARFGLEVRTPLTGSDRAFSLESADFDQDGRSDVAVGLYQSPVLLLFSGDAASPLVLRRSEPTDPDLRALLAGDFDGDGYPDLACLSAAGHLNVLENRGDFLLPGGALTRSRYPFLPGEFQARALEAWDLNGDGDLDLIALGDESGRVLLGTGGMGFKDSDEIFPAGTAASSSSIAIGDFGGSGLPEIVLGSRLFSSVTVLSKTQAGEYVPSLAVDVPSGRLLARGDVDGDGKDDLVGSGEVLWTALSGQPPRKSDPLTESPPERIGGLVINEVLASNSRFQVGPNRKAWDWIELFNGSPVGAPPLQLAGYRLNMVARNAEHGSFLFGPFELESGAHLLLYCTDRKKNVAFTTNFNLAKEGATLTLLKPDGNEADRVEYPVQFQDISFGRYRDGSGGFTFNPFPSPGTPNLDNGPIKPQVKLLAVVADDASLGDLIHPPAPGKPVRFFASAEDDTGVLSVRLFYGDPGHRTPVTLFDDGEHGDEAPHDGIFSNVIPYDEIFGPGGGSCVSVEVEDVDGEVSTAPDEGDSGDGLEGNGYCLELFDDDASVEISEIEPSNKEGLTDESGGHPDWVELSNSSARPISLGNLFLGSSFPANDDWFSFPSDAELPARGKYVVFCDGHPEQGDHHANFTLNADGGQVYLIAQGTRWLRSGAYHIHDAVQYPSLTADKSWAKTSGGWKKSYPTPGASNSPDLLGDVDLSGSTDIADCMLVLAHLFDGGSLSCPLAADVDGDGTVDINDAMALLAHLFGGEGPLPDWDGGCNP